MMLGLEIKFRLFADVAQRLVVFLAAGQQILVGQIGQAQHGGLEFHAQILQLSSFILDGSIQSDALGLVGFDLGIQLAGVLALLLKTLLLAEQLAVFLSQLVLLGGLGLGCGLQTTDLAVQLQNAVYDLVAIHFLGFQTGLDSIGIFFDSFNV